MTLRSKSPHSLLLTLPTAPCSLLATTLRAPHLTSHCHSPTYPNLPPSPGAWLRTARRAPGEHAPPFFSFLFCLLCCGQTVLSSLRSRPRPKTLKNTQTLPPSHPSSYPRSGTPHYPVPVCVWGLGPSRQGRGLLSTFVPRGVSKAHAISHCVPLFSVNCRDSKSTFHWEQGLAGLPAKRPPLH